MATAVPCGGRDNEANGCRKLFPKLAGDVCHKCKRAKRTTSAEERNLVLMMSQCSSCGISGDFVTDPCGECMNCASILDAERADRSQHMLARMTPRGSMPSPRPATSLNSLNASVILSRHTPSMPTSSQRQSTILRGTTMVTALFKPTTIGFRPVSSGTDFCSRIGRFEIQIAETATISDLRAQAVARINTKWTETNITGFQETDCDLRFPGNVAFEPADMLLTVKEFLKLLAPGGARFTQWIASDLPGYKTMKKHTYINSEIQVDYSSYQIRQEEIDEQSDGTGPSTKMSFRLPRRSLITSQVKSNLGKRKHSLDSMRPPQPLRSSFAPFGSLAQPTRTHHESLIVPPPPPPSVATPPRTDTPSEIVFFHIMTCIIDPETFEPTYTEETGELKEAMIGKLPMVLARKDAGITKDVYKFKWDEADWVAKKVVNLGIGELITPNRVERETKSSFMLLKMLESFYAKFVQDARMKGISDSVAELEISDAFIANLDLYPHLHKFGSLYIVEKLRDTAVRKFTGTMDQVTANDKVGGTVAALAHWIISDTACQMALVDLQATQRKREDGSLVWVLFDPMAHTIQGSSNLGDHGPDGIRTFIDGHTCNIICQRFKLPAKDVLFLTLDGHLQDDQTPEQSPVKKVTKKKKKKTQH